MLVRSDSSGVWLISPYLHSHARNLAVIFDSALKFDKKKLILLSKVVCYFHLRNIATLKPLLSFNDLKTVTTALISSRLNYCISRSSPSRSRLVQNAAARANNWHKEERQHHTYTGLPALVTSQV